MASLASAPLLPETRYSAASPEPRVVASSDITAMSGTTYERPYERSVYAPSRRSGPVAFLASAGVLLAAMAALATLNIVGRTQAAPHLTVVEMKELDITPPPPPPKQLEQPVVQPPVFVPKPRIALPSPGPTQVALDVAPPPAPAPQVVAPKAVVAENTAPAAPPAASASPVEGGDLSSQVLSAKPPTYPIEARRHRDQGTVKLMVLVGPDGRVSDLTVASSSGSSLLDRAALSAVKRWRWTPQSRNGSPVAVRGYVTIPFVLV